MKRDPSLKKVMLYGDLGKRFGRVHWIAVDSAGEVTRQALPARCPGFRAYMAERFDQPFRVIVGTEALDEKGLDAPVGRAEVIKIVPVVRGAKSDGVQMILGAVLVAVGTVFPVVSFLVPVGYSMILGGVAQMLTATPVNQVDGQMGKDRESWAFGSPTMTTGQGGCVPYCGGLHRISGHVISSGIDAQTYQDKGFGGAAPDNAGTRGGNGDTLPWVWAIAE